MKHTRRGFMKMGLATLPLAGHADANELLAFARTDSNLQNDAHEAVSTDDVNGAKTPIGAPFKADYLFSGSELSGWHVFGQADWRAEDGELVGTPHSGSKGGWLVLDKSYQDVLFFGRFRVSPGSRTGVLVRAEKTLGGGLKGIFLCLDPQDLNSYHVTLDSEGQEISRSLLGVVSGDSDRFALPVAPGSQVPEQAKHSQITFPAGDWNSVSVQMDANIFYPRINGGYGLKPGATDNDASCSGYGPIALYAGGSGETRFKDVCYKDFGYYVTPIEKVSSNYRMQRIDDFYFTWGTSVADVNRDGIPDIVTGPYYYLGPDYTVKREISLAQTFAPGREFDTTMVVYADDFTGDGWPDLLVATLDVPLTLYRNPRGELRRWDKFIVGPRVSSEIAVYADVNNDGKKEIVFLTQVDHQRVSGMRISQVVYAAPDPNNPTGDWIIHSVSEPGSWNGHGMGVGDITGDGTPNILVSTGWFEPPPKGSARKFWKYHPVPFTPDPPSERTYRSGGALMAVYDVNGDGLNDVVTSLHAHGFGLAWFEQKRDGDGNISFVRHMIMDDFGTNNAGGVTFTELHGSNYADMDGDGIPDFITGKRYISEDTPLDPDPWGTPVLYIYHTVRDKSAPGGARFEPELIHNRSGVGSMVTVADLNGNGAMDIITSTNRGSFIFWGQPHSKRKAATE